MKVLKTIMLALFATLTFMSCKKENNDPPVPPTIEGRWEGLFGYGSQTPGSFFAFQIKPGGVLERINTDGTVTGTGTWSLSSTVFVGTYLNVGDTYSVAATYNAATGSLTGSWGYGANTGDGGLFELSKKN
jgi:hypothetical protein